jgi:hypothetical protein
MLSCSSCSLHSASYPPREPAQELRPGSDPGGRFGLQGPRIRSKLAQCIGQLRRTNCLPPQQLVSPASLQKGIRQLIHITAFPQSEITRRLPHRIIQNPHELYRNALNRAERNYVPISLVPKSRISVCTGDGVAADAPKMWSEEVLPPSQFRLGS